MAIEKNALTDEELNEVAGGRRPPSAVNTAQSDSADALPIVENSTATIPIRLNGLLPNLAEDPLDNAWAKDST